MDKQSKKVVKKTKATPKRIVKKKLPKYEEIDWEKFIDWKTVTKERKQQILTMMNRGVKGKDKFLFEGGIGSPVSEEKINDWFEFKDLQVRIRELEYKVQKLEAKNG